jgi:hypothetical protein
MLSAPGLWVQRLTTKEPTEDMLEIAIISTKCALRDEIAEFEEFFNARPWEKKPNDEEAEAQSSDGESKTDPEENLESVSAFETELVAEEKNENLPEGEEA